MPAGLLQLDPCIPVVGPLGKGQAMGWIDYGAEGELLWIVGDDATGQIWLLPTKDVRLQANLSMGRHRPEKPVALTDIENRR